MIVADLGAGTGFYAIPLAHMVPRGKVYAVEIQEDYAKVLQNKIKEPALKNIEIIRGDVEKLGGTKIKDQIADVIIASNILFQVEDKKGFIEEVSRILKPAGTLLLVDWSDSSSFGPTQKNVIVKSKAEEMLAKHGFTLVREIDAGEHHYGMILKKQS